MCLKLYQFRRITWRCLYVLVSIMEFVMEHVLQSALLGKILRKVMVSWSLHQAHVLEVHETLSIVRHIGLHVDFSSMKSSLGL